MKLNVFIKVICVTGVFLFAHCTIFGQDSLRVESIRNYNPKRVKALVITGSVGYVGTLVLLCPKDGRDFRAFINNRENPAGDHLPGPVQGNCQRRDGMFKGNYSNSLTEAVCKEL